MSSYRTGEPAAVTDERAMDWEVLREQARVGFEDVFLVAGSAVLPFARASSDVDLFVITKNAFAPELLHQRSMERLPEQQANGFLLAYLSASEQRLDLEVWPRLRVDQAIRDMGTGVAALSVIEQHFSRLAGLERKVGLDLFHAIFVGQADTQSEQALRELRSTIDWVRFLSWNRDYHLLNAADGMEGTVRSLVGGHLFEAYMKVCWAADNLVDGLIFQAGHSISRWKWRLRYLPIIDRGIAEWYREVRFGGAAKSEATIRGWLRLMEDVIDRTRGTHPVLPNRFR